jgi:hypothetical protein
MKVIVMDDRSRKAAAGLVIRCLMAVALLSAGTIAEAQPGARPAPRAGAAPAAPPAPPSATQRPSISAPFVIKPPAAPRSPQPFSCAQQRDFELFGPLQKARLWAKECAKERAAIAQGKPVNPNPPVPGRPERPGVSFRMTDPEVLKLLPYVGGEAGPDVRAVESAWYQESPPTDWVYATVQGKTPAETGLLQRDAFAFLASFATALGQLEPSEAGRVYPRTAILDYTRQVRWLDGRGIYNVQDLRAPSLAAARTALHKQLLDCFSEQSVALFHSSAQSGPATAASWNPADLPSWMQADLAKAHGATDLTVFGFDFGQPIDLAQCPSQGGGLGGGLLNALSTKWGAPEACLGDATDDLRQAASPWGLLSALTGIKPERRPPGQLAVTLASSKCPAWLQSQASSCAMQARIAFGALVSIVVAPGADDGALHDVPDDLAEKYGAPDKRFAVRCVSQESSTATGWAGGQMVTTTVPLPPVTHEGFGLAWSKLPGLVVRYVPFASEVNCRSGFIQVALAGYNKMGAEAATKARAARPKM